jgi:hypothetical protein
MKTRSARTKLTTRGAPVANEGAQPAPAEGAASHSITVLCVDDHAVLIEGLKAQFAIDGRIEIIGRLPTYTTVTSFVVTPVIALVQAPYTVALDSFEVAEAFEVPLAWLMNPAHHRRPAAQGAVDLPPNRGRRLRVLVAAGTGSAPFVSMIRSELRRVRRVCRPHRGRACRLRHVRRPCPFQFPN